MCGIKLLSMKSLSEIGTHTTLQKSQNDLEDFCLFKKGIIDTYMHAIQLPI